MDSDDELDAAFERCANTVTDSEDDDADIESAGGLERPKRVKGRKRKRVFTAAKAKRKVDKEGYENPIKREKRKAKNQAYRQAKKEEREALKELALLDAEHASKSIGGPTLLSTPTGLRSARAPSASPTPASPAPTRTSRHLDAQLKRIPADLIAVLRSQQLRWPTREMRRAWAGFTSHHHILLSIFLFGDARFKNGVPLRVACGAPASSELPLPPAPEFLTFSQVANWYELIFREASVYMRNNTQGIPYSLADLRMLRLEGFHAAIVEFQQAGFITAHIDLAEYEADTLLEMDTEFLQIRDLHTLLLLERYFLQYNLSVAPVTKVLIDREHRLFYVDHVHQMGLAQ